MDATLTVADCTCGRPTDPADHAATCPANPDLVVCGCGEPVDTDTPRDPDCLVDHCPDCVDGCAACSRARSAALPACLSFDD